MWACQMHGMSKRNERIATTVKLCRKKLMAAFTASGSTGSSARLDCIGIRRDATFYTGRLSPFQSVVCGRVSSRQQAGRISPVFLQGAKKKCCSQFTWHVLHTRCCVVSVYLFYFPFAAGLYR